MYFLKNGLKKLKYIYKIRMIRPNLGQVRRNIKWEPQKLFVK